MENYFDVFISFKNSGFDGRPTEDVRIAEQLYAEFNKMGISAFYSNVKLLELGAATYKRSIEQALDQARVLIIIASDLAYLDTEWLSYERESFHDDILSGRKKNACIIPYIVNSTSSEVPRSLRGYEIFDIRSATVDTIAQFTVNFLHNNSTSHHEEFHRRSITTGKTVSTYRANYGREFTRLKIQAQNTRPADMPAIEYVLERIKNDNIKILDAGCAYGYVTKDRFENIPGSFVLGVDYNEKCLEYARENNCPDNFAYEKLNLEDENFEADLSEIMQKYNIESFDVIFASLVIHHLTNPNKFLKRIRRFLSKDGYIIIRGSDDGSTIAVNDDGLVQKIIDLHTSTEGISDRFNGRKIYSQLLGSGYKNVKMMNYIKEISGLDVDERADVFEERFAYRRNYLKQVYDRNPHNMESRDNLELMDYALECLENKFSEDNFWYCEIDFVGIAQKK
jgi:SAM-dependent methyltransferase